MDITLFMTVISEEEEEGQKTDQAASSAMSEYKGEALSQTAPKKD